jgi:hypothetical protein
VVVIKIEGVTGKQPIYNDIYDNRGIPRSGIPFMKKNSNPTDTLASFGKPTSPENKWARTEARTNLKEGFACACIPYLAAYPVRKSAST